MKNTSRFILYILLGLMVIGGILLIIYSDGIKTYLQGQTGLTLVTPAPLKVVAARDTIDPNILNSPRLATLVNNVVNFNFDNICWRPDTVLNQASTTATSSVGAAAAANCVQGNGLPFIAKTK